MSIDVLNSKLKGVQASIDLGVPGLKRVRDSIIAQIQSAAMDLASDDALDPTPSSVRCERLLLGGIPN
jgi:hypothetical protein